MDAKKILDMLTIEDIPGEQRDIAETVGIEIYKELVKLFGGGRVYIMQIENVTRKKRDDLIRAEFNGYNKKELCRKYGIADTTLRAIVKNR